MQPLQNRLLRVTTMWMAAGLVLLAIAIPLLKAFTLLAVMAAFGIVAAYLAAGLGIWLTAIRQFSKERRARFVFVGGLVPGFLLCAWFGGGTVMWAGDFAFGYSRFWALRPFYDQVVRQTLDPSGSQRPGSSGLISYEVDPGPPVRIVFPHFGGIVDNWEGTIYDPTDAVAAAQGWTFRSGKQEFTAPPRIRSLFGGDVVVCSRLQGHYYRCAFT